MQSTEVIMAQITKDISYIKQSLDKNDEQHKELFEKIESWLHEAEQRFAPKWVADVVKFILGAVGIIIIGAFMTLIVNR